MTSKSRSRRRSRRKRTRKSKCTRKIVAHDMHKWKKGTLYSHGKRVESQKQAIAIALSQSRRKCR